MIKTKNCSLKIAPLIYVHSYTPDVMVVWNMAKFSVQTRIQNIVYFTRVVTNERKFSWRWNIVGKLFQGMKNNLWKNESKTIFCCLERALWKCTEGMIEICKLGRFWPISNFRILAKIKTCWNFWILFLKTVHQKGLGAKKKSWSFASVAGFLKNTDNLS